MELLTQLASVALVLALLGGAVWLLKSKQLAMVRLSGTKQLEIVERVALGPQHSLSLVRVNGEMLLVGTGPGVCEIHHVSTAS